MMPRQRRTSRGVGLVELLIALAITAALLVAVAFATESAFRAYQINQEQSSLLQTTRNAIQRMTASLRTSAVHSPLTPSVKLAFSSGLLCSDSGVAMFDSAGREIIYRLDDGRLLVEVDGDEHLLLTGVTDFTISFEPMRSPNAIRAGTGYDLLRRATIRLSVRQTDETAQSSETTASQTLTLSAAVMPRQNTW